MNELKPILYLSLHNQLKKKYGINMISRKELWVKLRKHSQVPKPLRDDVLKEMCNLGLLKKENRDNYLIIDLKIDLERDSNLFFERILGKNIQSNERRRNG